MKHSLILALVLGIACGCSAPTLAQQPEPLAAPATAAAETADEFPTYAQWQRVAIHELGHATVAWRSSGFFNFIATYMRAHLKPIKFIRGQTSVPTPRNELQLPPDAPYLWEGLAGVLGGIAAEMQLLGGTDSDYSSDQALAISYAEMLMSGSVLAFPKVKVYGEKELLAHLPEYWSYVTGEEPKPEQIPPFIKNAGPAMKIMLLRAYRHAWFVIQKDKAKIRELSEILIKERVVDDIDMEQALGPRGIPKPPAPAPQQQPQKPKPMDFDLQ